MRITVFGASGKVGSRVVELALARGYQVTAFVHSRDLFAPHNNLLVIKGDVYQPVDVAEALKGSGAVVSCLGSWGTPKRNVLTAAMEALIPAMRKQGIDRIVTLTGSGAASPTARVSGMHRLFLRALSLFPAGKVFRDGEQHMRLLAESGLRWTTLRSPVMTNTGSKGYRLDLKAPGPLATIRREAVATAMLDQLDSAEFIGQAPIIHRN